MKALFYYLLLPFIYLLSVLPFFILHGVADIIFILLYYVIGYRRKVVRTNLINSFPDKSPQEINRIERRFYRYFCDVFMEILKALTISKAALAKRCVMTPQAHAHFKKYTDEQKSIVVVMGHMGNWEWGSNSFSINNSHQLYAIYHELTNPYFDRLMKGMRQRFGAKFIEMRQIYREVLALKGGSNAIGFIADQTPPPEGAYWTQFLNQDTPVFWGTEKIARKMNYPVIYAGLRRIGRSRYEIFAETLCEVPSQTKEGEISEWHTRRLEKDIIANPEIWLWSHRRWKHKRAK